MTHPPAPRSLVLLAPLLVGVVLAMPRAAVHGQGSHRLLDPPNGASEGFGANADLLRELQRSVEASANPPELPFDPEGLDPKLLEALQSLASQLEQHEQLPPQLKEWLEKARSRQSASPSPGGQWPSVEKPTIQPGKTPGREHLSRPPPSERSPRDAVTPSPFKPHNGPPSKSPGDLRRDTRPAEKSELRLGNRQPGKAAPQLDSSRPAVPGSTDDPQLGKNFKPNGRNATLEQFRESGMTLAQQFDRVVEQARREALLNRDGPKESDAEKGELSRLLDGALAKTSEEVIDRIKTSRGDRKRVAPRRERDRRERAATPPPAPRLDRTTERRPTLNQRFDSFAQRATRLTQSITTPPQAVEQSAMPEIEPGLPESSTSSSVLLLLLIALVMGGCAYGLSRWIRLQNRVRSGVRFLNAPAELSTRSDVLRAFHALSAMTLAGEHLWWTHRRAERALVESSPHAREALQALAQVYEQARYLPHDEPLNGEQLHRARETLALLLASRTAPPLRGDQ